MLAQEEIAVKNDVREIRQKVEESRSSLSANCSRGRVLDALIQQKKQGKIPGIFGRLVCLNIFQLNNVLMGRLL